MKIKITGSHWTSDFFVCWCWHD